MKTGPRSRVPCSSLLAAHGLGFEGRNCGVSNRCAGCWTRCKWRWMADFANSGPAFQELVCLCSFDVRLFAIISYCLQCDLD